MPDSERQLAPATPDQPRPGALDPARAEASGPALEAQLVERLARHRTLGGAPAGELEWVARHGQLERFQPGEVVSRPSQPVSGMYILLTGRLSIHLLRNGTRHKVAEWRAGDVTGLLPYSRMITPPGETIVDEPTEAILVPGELLPAMARDCHEVTSLLVHVMLDRARFFTSTFLHDEKLKSLGKLAAGLAHELNNPAAAITRFASVLPGALEAAGAAARQVGAAGLSDEELETARETSARCFATPLREVRSPLDEARREEAIADWLEARGLDPDRAEPLAHSRLSLEALDGLAARLPQAVLEPVLRWVAADCSVRDLAQEIEQAGARISQLVTAVRGFTRVDASAVPEPVDVAEGLGQTFAVLKGKARGKAIGMGMTIEERLPRVRAIAAELNQIWANLIDNALDAAPRSGHVEVAARRGQDRVEVSIADDGPGVPPEIRDRIFDPFFTTKDVGQGTGLGLDIVRRLVERHDGSIAVQSEPGRTVFTVSLPAADGGARGGQA